MLNLLLTKKEIVDKVILVAEKDDEILQQRFS